VTDPVGCLSQSWIREQRDLRYRRTPERRVQTVEGARALVQDVGFCFLWPIKDIEMPSLFHAIAGHARPVPMKHNDPDLSKCWGWKDRALGQRWWYYGKMLRRRATLVSLDLLPCFYACSENYGELDDYLEEYRAGTMSAEARSIYEALLDHGPLNTVRLRREARMAAESAKSRFGRALVELQVGLKVLPVGVAQAGAWRYAFVYDIVQRHYPGLPGEAQQIRRSEARQTLVARYLENVVATDLNMIQRVFHILRWTATELDGALAALIKAGTIRQVCVNGEAAKQFVSTSFL
jgi:hypothetical protein